MGGEDRPARRSGRARRGCARAAPAGRSPRGGWSRRGSRRDRARAGRGSSTARARPARGGSDASAITSPTTSIRPGDALLHERRPRALVRAEEQRCHAVDGDPVALLGHRQVAAAQPRLDVRDGDGARCLGAGERRVRIAVHEHPVGQLALDRGGDPRPHRAGIGAVQVEPVCRLREPELLEEDVGELSVVVLAGVEHDLVDPCRRAARPTPGPT